jgi:hypothetical protein
MAASASAPCAHALRAPNARLPEPLLAPPRPLPSAAAAAAACGAPLDGARAFVCGGLSGCVAKVVTHPLARIVILQQTGAAAPALAQLGAGVPSAAAARALARAPALGCGGAGGAVGEILRREGVAGLWKGSGLTLAHRFPYAGVNFVTYRALRKRLCATQPPPRQPAAAAGGRQAGAGTAPLGEGSSALAQRLGALAAGSGAGAAAVVAAYPLDAMRTRKCAQLGAAQLGGDVQLVLAGGGGGATTAAPALALGGAGAALRARWRAVGPALRYHYHGLGPALSTVVPVVAMNWALFEALRGVRVRIGSGGGGGEGGEPRNAAALPAWLCGALAGSTSAVTFFPVDTVRRNMQCQAQRLLDEGARARGLGFWAATRALVRARGVRGLYTGLPVELLKVVPSAALTFGTYDVLDRALR